MPTTNLEIRKNNAPILVGKNNVQPALHCRGIVSCMMD